MRGWSSRMRSCCCLQRSLCLPPTPQLVVAGAAPHRLSSAGHGSLPLLALPLALSASAGGPGRALQKTTLLPSSGLPHGALKQGGLRSRSCAGQSVDPISTSLTLGRQVRARGPAQGPSGGRRLRPAPRAPAQPARAPATGRRRRRRRRQRRTGSPAASAASPGASGAAGRPDQRTQSLAGRRCRAGHGGRLLWRRPRGGRPGPRELRAAPPDPAAGGGLGVLHRRVRAHCQRGLRELGQRPGAALRLQRERGRLSVRGGAGPRGLPGLRRLPAARRPLPADQQRPRPPPRGAAGPGLLRALVLPVVCGLLLPRQSVAAHGSRARHGAGGGRGAGRHHLQLLLHPQLGGAHREGPAAVPPGHRHVALRHRSAGRRGGPGLPWLPGGQRCGGHRDLPEPALHRDPGYQPQRVPGACLLVVGRLRPGLQGHPTVPGLKASWNLGPVLPARVRDRKSGHCGPLGPGRGNLPGVPGHPCTSSPVSPRSQA